MPSLSQDEINMLIKDNSMKILTDILQIKNRKSWRQRINMSEIDIKEFNKYPSPDSDYDNFLDLLSKILVLDKTARLTATEMLDHPFFNGYREIIDWCRNIHPPNKKVEVSIDIFSCIERKWATKIAFILYNARNSLTWYRHRIIFQSIDLFDRYLVYLKDEMKNKEKVESEFSGKLMSRSDTHLRYLTCLYMSIKYFSTLTIPVPFSDLLREIDIRETKSDYFQAEEFEKKLLKDIYRFKIYRETVFEACDRLYFKLNENQIRDLLYNYGISSSKENIKLTDLIKEYLKL